MLIEDPAVVAEVLGLVEAALDADALRALPVFAGLEERTLRELLELGRPRRLSRREPVSASRVATTESYCFLLDGIVGVPRAANPLDRA